MTISYSLITKIPTALDILLNPFAKYTLPLDEWINTGVDFLVQNFRPIFQAIRFPISFALDGIESLLLSIPPLIFMIVVGLIVWKIAGKGIAIYSIMALTIIGLVGVWQEAVMTLALVGTAVGFCLIIGIPIGIACARSQRLDKLIRPLLDLMQTFPTFVYLIPAVMLFGIGKIPGAIATIIVAVPPLIRLTILGIKQVSPEIVEAAKAFGSTPGQILWEIQLPLAIPTILAGVNQTVLFALRMSVIASMIAADGLGMIVLQGINRLDLGMATVGGLGIVAIAIMLDRITQAVGKQWTVDN